MSLIQQRIAIDRERLVGTVFATTGAVMLILNLITIATGNESIGMLIGSLIFLSIGITKLRNSRRTRRAFEATHGHDAGVQTDRENVYTFG